MKVDLTFRNESVNDHPVTVLKSALQKYVRRANTDGGLMVISLLDAIKDDMGPSAKRIRTNITNRLVAMMTEEVNIHEVDVPILMQQLHLDWMRSRAKDVWVKMFMLLLTSRKSRIVSDYKTLYNLPPYMSSNLERLDSIHSGLLQKFGRPEVNVECTLQSFAEHLQNKQMNSLQILRTLLRTSIASNKLWSAIKAVETEHQRTSGAIEALHYFHQKMTHKEKPIYMYHAILLVLLEGRLDHVSERTVVDINEMTPMLVNSKETARLFSGPFEDYILDLHTGCRQKNSLDFATSGALIPDEDQRFMEPELRNMYIEFKEKYSNG